MKSPISLAIITKNDPAIVNCIASLRPYVEEIVVVDGGSTKENQELVRGLVDVFEVYTEGNDPKTGLIEDFSKQRNRSFELATQPWILWCDSDDLITGGEHLADIIKNYKDPTMIMFPYEYGYDNNGKCLLLHYRERLFLSKHCFQWISPVHEVCVSKPGIRVVSETRNELVWKHQRQYNPKGIESGRNLRIMKKHVENGHKNARSLFYLAQEYKDGGYPEEAIETYTKYLEVSQWNEEKLMACLRLSEIERDRANYDKSLGWSLKAIQTKSDWSEGYFAAGRDFYFLEKWKECVDFIKLGFSYSETKTSLFINPTERGFEIHRYLNFALNKIGKVQEALDSCNTALQYQYDECLNMNRRMYEDHITPPVYQKKNLTKKKLDIVFAIGDGMEEWTSETIQTTGIGGSETMAANMAKGLAALGHNVSLYNSCGFKSIYDNVYYYPTECLKDVKSCDVFIASRQANFLDYDIDAKLKLLWCHDVILTGVTEQRLRKADKILALTRWHKNNIINVHHVLEDKVLVTRNGIDLKRFSKDVERVKYKCINSSSPDRGLPFLLDMWSDIKAAVPEATLDLYYGFNNWIKSLEVNPSMRPIIEKIQKQIADLEPLGVTYHGRVGPAELAEAFMSSDCWLHPSNFSETSCITAMEAQASGCRMITCPVAALNETAGDRAVMVDPGNLPWDAFLSAPHAEFKKRYVEAVVETLNKPDGDDRAALQEYAKEHFDMDKLCQEWNDLFYSL